MFYSSFRTRVPLHTQVHSLKDALLLHSNSEAFLCTYVPVVYINQHFSISTRIFENRNYFHQVFFLNLTAHLLGLTSDSLLFYLLQLVLGEGKDTSSVFTKPAV